MSISWAGLADAIEEGAILYLADGSVRLRAVDVRTALATRSKSRSRSAAPSPRARA